MKPRARIEGAMLPTLPIDHLLCTLSVRSPDIAETVLCFSSMITSVRSPDIAETVLCFSSMITFFLSHHSLCLTLSWLHAFHMRAAFRRLVYSSPTFKFKFKFLLPLVTAHIIIIT